MKPWLVLAWQLARRVWWFMLFGSDDLVLSTTWLNDTRQMQKHADYTTRQQDQGVVVATVEQCRVKEAEAAAARAAFWAWRDQVAAAKQARPVLRFIARG